ncbi:hypothetical protein BC777_3138 [Yoonia maricola]|uniref:Uncharacterized protein n=1 Tax=Yoonia maricola TaxID=420999 RepID=A0A2M8W2J6_9RHOB|nr:hypothetical protein [Yoonia maricola]PJI85141.1 hypothetical protein BC777_3138 [Yoonia maricola]
MNTKRTLLMIAAFVILTLGSFIWYIATWDAAERTGLIQTDAPLIQSAMAAAPALTKGTAL